MDVHAAKKNRNHGYGMENLAPEWLPRGFSGCFRDTPMHASSEIQHHQCMQQGIPGAAAMSCQHQSLQEAHGQQHGGNMDQEMIHCNQPFSNQNQPQAAAPHEGDGMEMDSSDNPRFARFPPNLSPTHWHKATAVSVPDLTAAMSGIVPASLDEHAVRGWECGYGGKSDYY